jgi:hypothetical protein
MIGEFMNATFENNERFSLWFSLRSCQAYSGGRKSMTNLDQGHASWPTQQNQDTVNLSYHEICELPQAGKWSDRDSIGIIYSVADPSSYPRKRGNSNAKSINENLPPSPGSCSARWLHDNLSIITENRSHFLSAGELWSEGTRILFCNALVSQTFELNLQTILQEMEDSYEFCDDFEGQTIIFGISDR